MPWFGKARKRQNLNLFRKFVNDRNIHLNDKFPLKIAKIPHQKQNEIPKFHIFCMHDVRSIETNGSPQSKQQLINIDQWSLLAI